jgi:hypothetical protein
MKKQRFYYISKYIAICKSIKIAIIFFILFNIFFIKNSYAEIKQSIRVSPIINDLQLVPGEITTIDLTVENLSNSSLGIHAEILGIDETNQKIFTDQRPSSLTKWTTISAPDIILDPLSQKLIPITITTPKDAKQNGYYETIFLTPIISSKNEPTSPVVLTRIGAIILGTIGKLDHNDLAKKVSIKDFKPEKYFFEKTPATLNFFVENKYFTHFTAKPFVTIEPLFGQENTTQLEEKHVLPGASKSWRLQVDQGKSIFYKIRLAVSVGNGKQIFAETWFMVLPYKLILTLIAVFGIACLILFARNRIRKAIMALIEKN